MAEPSPSNQAEQKELTPEEYERRVVIPSWVVSAIVHAVLLVVLGLSFQATPPGAAEESTRSAGIVLKKYTPQGEEYFEDGDDSELVESDSNTDSQQMQDALMESLADTPATNPGDALPSESELVLGAGSPNVGEVGNAGGFTAGGPPRRNPPGGKAKTQVFGVEGEGNSFVYVFDRSTSMGGVPLRAAKAEMIASLDSLADTHQFQIVFYSTNASVFNPGGRGRLSFADERAKNLAKRFIGGITADGNTNHLDALNKALQMGPDVIFFLTDGGDELSAKAVNEITQDNRGAVAIHAIEFGTGPKAESYNFVQRLAGQNGGKYQYIDTTRLRVR